MRISAFLRYHETAFEGYRKIRNTARYILSNLADFDPEKDFVPAEKLMELDLWAVHALNELIQKVDAGYNSFDFHVVYHAIHNFCVVDMSNFYLDIIKDRLYCEEWTASSAAVHSRQFI